jgi:hypothetical protein
MKGRCAKKFAYHMTLFVCGGGGGLGQLDIIQAIGQWTSQLWKISICNNPTVRTELQLAALRACQS